MATVIKSVFVTENHSAYLYESGAVILRMNGSKFGTVMDRDLAGCFGSEILRKLVEDGEVLRAPKQAPKPVKTTKRAPEPVKTIQGDHRVDLLQAQVDSLAKGQAETLKLLQQMVAQNSTRATVLNMAE